MANIEFGDLASVDSSEHIGGLESIKQLPLNYDETQRQPPKDINNCVLYCVAQVAYSINPESTFSVHEAKQDLIERDRQYQALRASQRRDGTLNEGERNPHVAPSGNVDLMQYAIWRQREPLPGVEVKYVNFEHEYAQAISEGGYLIIDVGGHAYIVSGYKKTLNGLQFTIHDPYEPSNVTTTRDYASITRRNNFALVMKKAPIKNDDRIQFASVTAPKAYPGITFSDASHANDTEIPANATVSEPKIVFGEALNSNTTESQTEKPNIDVAKDIRDQVTIQTNRYAFLAKRPDNQALRDAMNKTEERIVAWKAQGYSFDMTTVGTTRTNPEGQTEEIVKPAVYWKGNLVVPAVTTIVEQEQKPPTKRIVFSKLR